MQINITDWLAGRLPQEWFTSVDVVTDREEITIRGTIDAPAGTGTDGETGRIARFRQETRPARIGIARELEAATGRKVSWTVACGGTVVPFTRLSVPVMTRLAQPQRQWCVRLVAQHEGEWLGRLEDAMTSVRDVRRGGPQA